MKTILKNLIEMNNILEDTAKIIDNICEDIELECTHCGLSFKLPLELAREMLFDNEDEVVLYCNNCNDLLTIQKVIYFAVI